MNHRIHSLVFSRKILGLLLLGSLASASWLKGQSLEISKVGDQTEIRWRAVNVVLEAAEKVEGPYRAVPEARSPYRVQPGDPRKFFRLRVTGPEPNVRDQDRPPLPEILAAVEAFQKADPQASFRYFNGHVDSFSTTPKPTIPDYARAVLESLGLSSEPRTPLTLRDPSHADRIPKPARDLDADFDRALPTLVETKTVPPEPSDGEVDKEDDPMGNERPKEDTRNKPPIDPQRLIPWERPDPRTLQLQSRAITPILQNFLEQHHEVFRVSPDQVESVLEQTGYQVGAYFRKAEYQQHPQEGLKLLYGRTLVLFDVNWNVINISRMITTPEKLAVNPVRNPIPQDKAVEIALQVPPSPDCRGLEVEVRRVQPCLDPVRRRMVWDVEVATLDGECHWRTILDAATGDILNVSDQIDRAYTDAKVNRWYYPGGDLFNPNQIVSTGIYTRNDRRLEHDFFYMMNDHRCEGFPESTCTETTPDSTWCAFAHGTTAGFSHIRATRRTNRDFDKYYPWGASEAFAETHAYYWARNFSQWLKPSLDALGALPASAANYPRVLIITDACRSGSVHNSSYAVSTENNKGEGINVIRLAHRNPGGTSDHNDSCEGGGCFDNPSNIAHELNHFYLKRYYGVGSDLDCGAANQLKFTHEGILGTAVPQAHWHSYYGVGYNPSSTSKLYFSHTDIGRVHTSNANRMTVGNYLCVDYTDDPYRAGRVAGQALWKFYHGKMVNGSTMSSTWYPSTDTDFNVLLYWAADLQSASTYKDRYEFANRMMEILDKYSNWSSSGKQDYCDIFEQHSLHWYINPAYCN